jgi:hypothetical protein
MQLSPLRKRLLGVIQEAKNKRHQVANRPAPAVDDRPFLLTRGRVAVVTKDLGLSVFEVVHRLMCIPPPRTFATLTKVLKEVRISLTRHCACNSKSVSYSFQQ